MKKKTLLGLLIVTVLCTIITMPVKAVTIPDCEVGKPLYVADIGGEEYFFANGAKITVEDRTDGVDGALVKWMEGTVEKTQKLGTVSNIFGGMHNNDTAVNSSITINGGYVNWIHGGGLHKSNTTTSTIVMNGGQVGHIKGGGADQWITGTCDCSNGKWHEGEYEHAPCQTGTATITINGGKILRFDPAKQAIVYGGGNGYANTEKANITINGGDLSAAYVIAGGSNGNTSEATLNITGGKINIVQSVNRGTMETVDVKVTGGEISKFYVGGDSEDSEVTGTVSEKITTEISGAAKIETMSLGTNGGTAIDVATSSVVTPENVKVAVGTVENLDRLGTNVTPVYQVKIDDTTYLVEEGKTIKDIPEYNDIIKKDGYKFVEFKSNGQTWDVSKTIDNNYELVTVFEEIIEEIPGTPGQDTDNSGVGNAIPEDNKDNKGEKDTTPKTGIESTVFTTVSALAIISLLSLIVIKKRK